MGRDWGDDMIDIDRVTCQQCGCDYDTSEDNQCPECHGDEHPFSDDALGQF